MEPAKIVLLAIVILCGFAAALGEACAWICPEAFTVARPAIFGGAPPAISGPIWCALETVHLAAGVGIGIALAAHVGHRPAVKAFFFTKPLLAILPLLAAMATLAGFLGYYAVGSGHYAVFDTTLKEGIPLERHPAYVATWWATLGNHAGMLVGGAVLAVWTWKKRAVFEQMVRDRGY
jgi:hypothetical protein